MPNSKEHDYTTHHARIGYERSHQVGFTHSVVVKHALTATCRKQVIAKMKKILVAFLVIKRNQQEYYENKCDGAGIVQWRYWTLGLPKCLPGHTDILSNVTVDECRVVAAITWQ